MRFSPSARSVQGECSLMVGSFVLPRFLASFSLVLLLAMWPIASHAQENSVPPEQTPSSSNTASATSSSHPTPNPADLEVSFRKMPTRFLPDEKDMLFPTKLGQAKHWIPTAIVVGGTAAFIKGDPSLERKVRQTDIFGDYNKVLKSSISGGQDARGEGSAEQDGAGSP